MKSRYHVMVLGAGNVGLCLAALLAQGGLDVALVEARELNFCFDAKNYDSRVSAITDASARLFAKLGAWSLMQQLRVSPYTDMHVWEEQSDAAIDFCCLDIAKPALGYIVENRVIGRALYQRAQQSGVDIISANPARDIHIDTHHAHLTLNTGQSVRAQLVVGADGANSWLRQQLNWPLREYDYHHHGLVATVSTELPHQQTAWQRFLTTGPLAFLPFTHSHHCSIVWSTQPSHADALLACTQDDFNQQLTQAFDHRLGDCQIQSELKRFPLIERHVADYVAPRAALIGDAAHTIHPLAGQGANLGFMDGALLAKQLIHAQAKQQDIGQLNVLRPFARQRREDNVTMMLAMRGFKQLFVNDKAPWQYARALGLKATQKNQWLKNKIMRKAMGLEVVYL